ncbi:hypothetical protein VOLCADRAFT_105698 [Volvox carteri f. nagariensis]|uniref:Uncharacterized protein n=1 Tax=Volvox carteri f. nagariensis TaxID=3068 RepID=D8U2F4_VOLCA|nr:uncharacterized protein VOLCADRAFT_105698 [Volvox carteri f. nagariensis]EFJ46053.1 hypothetical protein VOLCADRAFT_105698 [Volvox carteri f. nagariensis]|eukprot:XP_002952803.1 hypothetical protein VOLCADRAFT_105698 [Volvox carteri f. nagariensis]
MAGNPLLPPTILPSICQLLLTYIQRAALMATMLQPTESCAEQQELPHPPLQPQPQQQRLKSQINQQQLRHPQAMQPQTHLQQQLHHQQREGPKPGDATEPLPLLAVRQLRVFDIPAALLLQAAAHLLVVGAIPPTDYRAIQAELASQAAGVPAAGVGSLTPVQEGPLASADATAANAATPTAAAATATPTQPQLPPPRRVDAWGSFLVATAMVLALSVLLPEAFRGGLPWRLRRRRGAAAAAAPSLRVAATAVMDSVAASLWAGRGAGPSARRLGLGRRLFSAVADQLPCGTELDSILPPLYGYSGVLYRSKGNPYAASQPRYAGAALWDGALLRDLGTFTTAADARQNVLVSIKLIAAATAATGNVVLPTGKPMPASAAAAAPAAPSENAVAVAGGEPADKGHQQRRGTQAGVTAIATVAPKPGAVTLAPHQQQMMQQMQQMQQQQQLQLQLAAQATAAATAAAAAARSSSSAVANGSGGGGGGEPLPRKSSGTWTSAAAAAAGGYGRAGPAAATAAERSSKQQQQARLGLGGVERGKPGSEGTAVNSAAAAAAGAAAAIAAGGAAPDKAMAAAAATAAASSPETPGSGGTRLPHDDVIPEDDPEGQILLDLLSRTRSLQLSREHLAVLLHSTDGLTTLLALLQQQQQQRPARQLQPRQQQHIAAGKAPDGDSDHHAAPQVGALADRDDTEERISVEGEVAGQTSRDWQRGGDGSQLQLSRHVGAGGGSGAAAAGGNAPEGSGGCVASARNSRWQDEEPEQDFCDGEYDIEGPAVSMGLSLLGGELALLPAPDGGYAYTPLYESLSSSDGRSALSFVLRDLHRRRGAGGGGDGVRSSSGRTLIPAAAASHLLAAGSGTVLAGSSGGGGGGGGARQGPGGGGDCPRIPPPQQQRRHTQPHSPGPGGSFAPAAAAAGRGLMYSQGAFEHPAARQPAAAAAAAASAAATASGYGSRSAARELKPSLQRSYGHYPSNASDVHPRAGGGGEYGSLAVDHTAAMAANSQQQQQLLRRISSSLPSYGASLAGFGASMDDRSRRLQSGDPIPELSAEDCQPNGGGGGGAVAVTRRSGGVAAGHPVGDVSNSSDASGGGDGGGVRSYDDMGGGAAAAAAAAAAAPQAKRARHVVVGAPCGEYVAVSDLADLQQADSDPWDSGTAFGY